MKLCFKKGLALVMAVLMVMSTFGTMVFAADNIIDVNCEHENNEVYSTKYHAPTCESYGYDQVNFCHDCKFYYIPDEHVIPKTDHDYTVTHEHNGDVVTKISVCKNCGDVKLEDISNSTWELAQAADNCTLGSELVYKCTWTDCDVTKTVKGDGHNYVLRFDLDTYVKPTCEKDGNLTVTCEDCDYRAEIVIKKLNKNNGQCTWVEIDRLDATCTEDGYVKYECSECHAPKTEVLPATNHANYTIKGYNPEKRCEAYIECNDCDYEGTKHLPDPAMIRTEEVAPTCFSYGYRYEICLYCGEHVAEFVLDKLDHKAGDPVHKDADCLNPGSTYVYCVNEFEINGQKVACGAILSQSPEEENPALGHADGQWVILAGDEPTCVAPGKETFVCPRCNAPILDENNAVQTRVVAPDTENGHDLIGDPSKGSGSKITTDPTCTLWGEISVWCILCGMRDAHVNNLDIPEGWTNWYDGFVFEGTDEEVKKALEDKAIVEVAEGVYIYAQFDIRPLGHKWGAIVETTPMNCLHDGIGTSTCERCGVTSTEVVTIPCNPFAHDMSKAVLQPDHPDNRPATCTTPAYLMYKCGDCNRYFAEPTGTALDHKFVELDPGYAVNGCTGDGKLPTVQCSVCDAYKYDDTNKVLLDGSVIKAPGHTKVEVKAAPATCTTDGWNMDGWYCSVCGEKSDPALAKLLATGHDMTFVEFKVTCDSDGFLFFGCKNCGMETLEASYIDGFVYSTGHTWGTPVVIAPTCTEEGYTKIACTVCGEFEKKDPTPALGHTNAAGETIPDKCYPEFDHDFDADCVRCDHDIHTWFVTMHPGSCIWEYKYELYLCTVCEYQEARNIEKDPYPQHFPGTEVVITPPTAGAPGLKEIKCANPECDYTWTEEIPALGGFVFNTEVSAYNINTNSFTKKAVNSGYLAVTISMSGNDVELWGAQMSVAFDAEVLEFDAAKTQSYNAENVLTGKFNAVTTSTGAYVNIALSYTDDKKDNYLLDDDDVPYATLFFKIKDDKYGMTLDFDIIDGSELIVDKDNKVLSAVMYDSNEIDVYELGNVLIDGARNIQDANAIMAILDSATADKTNELADIDKDGEVTVKDFELMMLIIVDPAQYTVYLNVK